MYAPIKYYRVLYKVPGGIDAVFCNAAGAEEALAKFARTSPILAALSTEIHLSYCDDMSEGFVEERHSEQLIKDFIAYWNRGEQE